jgi:spermidine/putrescine transport system ATP-binding protein
MDDVERVIVPEAASPTVVPRGGHEVRIENITRAFGEIRAVDDVSLEIPAGEFLSILGPSGCGKTTLLRMLAGLDFPDAGRILIDGRDVTDLPPNRRPTNLVFQRGALFPHKSVFQNVAYPLERLGRPKADVVDGVTQALAMVRLADLGDRRPSELSGGQAQRVALARALVGKPAVLLLDEPLSALDLALRKEMQLELRRLQDELGTTFIYVTHDQEEALTMSSRIVIMRDGRVEQIGAPREIYDNPASIFASTFIGATNLLRGEVAGASGGVTVVRAAGHDLRVSDPRRLAVGTAVALSIRPERIIAAAGDLDAESWNVLPGTVMEQVFLGNRIRARVACAEMTIWLEEPSTAPSATRLAENAPARLAWPIADGRLIVVPDA